MTADKWAALREPFKPEQVGKKPQVNCGACTQATKNARSAADKHCDRHTVLKCPGCQAYITTGHIHLDFVGHAVTTSRLLSVDPEWTWEPMGYTPDGLPATDQAGNLWIWLTVLGVRRPGVGDGGSAKEAVGDAIRNAAMRFGVALDLWSKEELEHPADEPVRPVEASTPTAPPPADSDPLRAAKGRAWKASKAIDPSLPDDQRTRWIEAELRDIGTSMATATVVGWTELAERLEAKA